jgi:hypothetical protein
MMDIIAKLWRCGIYGANGQPKELGLQKQKSPAPWAGAKPTRGAGRISMGEN